VEALHDAPTGRYPVEDMGILGLLSYLDARRLKGVMAERNEDVTTM
jgi:hypothetical protein